MLQFRLTGTKMGLLVPGEVKNGLSGTKRGFLVPERILKGRAPTGLAIAARCLFLDVVTANLSQAGRLGADALLGWIGGAWRRLRGSGGYGPQ